MSGSRQMTPVYKIVVVLQLMFCRYPSHPGHTTLDRQAQFTSVDDVDVRIMVFTNSQ